MQRNCSFVTKKLEFTFVQQAAFVIFLIGLIGESLSDRQLTKFKSDPSNKGKVCNVGLWNYSRHPNYFFEIVIWVSYGMYSMQQPGGVWGVGSFLMMMFFICFVTGVPPSEKQSLKSRGDAYREYQKRTSILVPWFPKKG